MAEINRVILPALAAWALSITACAAEGTARPESSGSSPAVTVGGSVLSSSNPSNGAKLRSAPDKLILDFAKPVRLAEVTVAGSDGQLMPMMVSSAGASRRYELPLDGLEAGSYSIRWRAIDEAGIRHDGTIAFEIG